MKLLLENWNNYIAESQYLNTHQISLILKKANMYGFGGECAETAIAINDVLFNGKGKIVAAVNKWLWENEERIVGHVAVEWNGTYWDSEGEKEWEDIESWGMLDPDDEDYDFGDDKEQNAYEVEKIYPDKEELIDLFGGCNLPEKKKLLLSLRNKKSP
jgi:hypothetical protein